MLNPLKKFRSSLVAKNSALVVETIVKEGQSKSDYPAIVHQIHHEFNSASDKALKEAQEILKSCEAVSMDKAERLAKLGFKNVKEVKELQDFKSKQQAAENRAKLIQNASIDYPLYKFITEDDVQTLCTKYGLICGKLELFKGFVPEKNLKDIENSLLSFPKFYEICHKFYPRRGNIVSQKEYDKLLKSEKIDTQNNFLYEVPQQFYICAPPKDMEQRGYRVERVFLVKDDPIVLAKVSGGYLIITAWGDEASDPLVFNEKQN